MFWLHNNPRTMAFTAISLLFPALIVAATITPQQKLGKTFTIDQVPKSEVLKNGPLELARSHRKYGFEIPEHVAAAAANITAAAEAGLIAGRSLDANPIDTFDTLYLSPVTLGSDMLNLYLDTGSSDLYVFHRATTSYANRSFSRWVFSTLMDSSMTSGQSLYNPSNSGTRLPRQSWMIAYGDGSGAAGSVYADRVVAGEVTATRQSVEAATSVSSRFSQDSNSDGIMGLGFSSLNTVRPTPQRTFFDRIKSTLARPLFTALIKKGAPGKFDFGFLNSSSYTGSITYTTVSVRPRPGYWNFNATGYQVGNGPVVSQIIPSIVDTASTLFQLPPAVVRDYYSQVPGASYSDANAGWIYPCSSTLPAFTTVISGGLLRTPGSFLTYGSVDQGVTCYGGIQEATDVGFSIHGLIFLKSQYVVFDASTTPPKLGFARQSGVVYD